MSIYNQAGTGGYRKRFQEIGSGLKIRNFDRSDAFGEYNITREGVTFVDPFPVHIFATKSDGEKKYVCHPNYELNKGDMIEYTDDGYNYLVFEKDIHSTTDAFGKLKRAENSISFRDENNEVHTLYYYITNTGMGSQDSNYKVPVTSTRKQIWIQYNPTSKKIFKNQRFILNHLDPYKVTARDNFTINGILMLTLEETQVLDGDDFDNNIAYNEINITTIPESGKNGVYFTEDELEISLGNTVSVEVYNYINDVIDPLTLFTFRIDDIDSSNYEIVNSDDNSIELKCLEYLYSGTLVAIDQSTLDEYEIPLTLVSPLG